MSEFISSSDPLWDTVTVLTKKHKTKEQKNKAIREGKTESAKKRGNTEKTDKDKKLYNATDTDKHKKISLEQSKMISKARNDLKLSQVDLAKNINLKKEIINDYECGKAIIDNKILSKIERALKINVRKKSAK
jgi:ribosome-binding protein aMBF1 (putative translation factor)